MEFKPNNIPVGTRVFNILGSIFLVVYGGFGVYKNDLILPAKRGVIHLHDKPAIVHYMAFICAAIVMLSVVIDHYDQRNNEHKYKFFAKVVSGFGWFLFGASLIWSLALEIT